MANKINPLDPGLLEEEELGEKEGVKETGDEEKEKDDHFWEVDHEDEDDDRKEPKGDEEEM